MSLCEKNTASHTKRIHSDTSTGVVGKLPFDFFHRPKPIVGRASSSSNSVEEQSRSKTAVEKRRCNRPKVNLFPQISLTDVRDEDLDKVLNYMYSSDWKEASDFCAKNSCLNFGDGKRKDTNIGQRDTTGIFPDRFRKQSHKVPYFDLPNWDVDLDQWYKLKS